MKPKKYNKAKTALLSIVSNSFLIALKLIAGIFTGSIAIISEAIHSGLDLIASLLAYGSIKISDQPADREHPFGHGKAENISALFQALLIIFAGILIIKQAIISLISPQPLPNLGWGAMVMLISTGINFFVSQHLFKVGKKTDSAALIADAWHLRTDVYTSFGVVIGLTIIIISNFLNLSLNLNFIDPLCALIVALLILKAGFSLTFEAISNLMDSQLSNEDLEIIKNHILKYDGETLGYRNLKTRKSGSYKFIEFELLVTCSLTVEKAHTIGNEIQKKIKKDIKNSHINYHLEPSKENCCPLDL